MKEKYWIIERDGINEYVKEIANEYLSDLKSESYARNTIDKYSRVLEGFFLACPKDLHALTSDDIGDWLHCWLVDKKASTVNLTYAIPSSFFNYCLEEGYMDKKLIKKRMRTKMKKSLPKYLNNNELQRTEIAAEQLSIRDRALFEFLVSSGCRRAEASSLNVEQVDLENRSAHVIGKGGALEPIFFSNQCSFLLKQYLQEHQRSGGPLLLNKYGQRLSTKGIYRIMINIGKILGMLDNLHPHRLRYTFATSRLAKGASIKDVADALRHKNLNTTGIYAKVLNQDLISEYKKRMEYL